MSGRVFAARHPVLIRFAVLLALAFATRAWQFGNPAIQIDEQFYLLVGDRMLHGTLPFVDIWDRKPIGIFLIYAAIRLLGGDGIVEYQVVATLFAAATAFVIAGIARRFATERGAVCAGGAYLLWLVIFDGSGGQTPVFYNLVMAAAGAVTLGAIMAPARLFAWGSAAMLLTGIAMQIKYTAVFEGIFFGLILLWHRWRTGGMRGAALSGPVWIAMAVLPTACALAGYAAIGHADAFVYANFISILERDGWPAAVLVRRLGSIIGLSLPLLMFALLEWRSEPPAGDAAIARRFALGWLGAALAGLLVFGTYFIHYFLPVLVPLTLVCARLLDDRTAGLALIGNGRRLAMPLAAFLLLAGLALSAVVLPRHLRSRGPAGNVRALASAIRQDLNGCLYVFDGEPVLYHLGNACIATRWAFPNHLAEEPERNAIGVAPQVEVARILDRARPDMIVSSDRPVSDQNLDTLKLLNAALRRDYRPLFHVRIGNRQRILYKRLR